MQQTQKTHGAGPPGGPDLDSDDNVDSGLQQQLFSKQKMDQQGENRPSSESNQNEMLAKKKQRTSGGRQQRRSKEVQNDDQVQSSIIAEKMKRGGARRSKESKGSKKDGRDLGTSTTTARERRRQELSNEENENYSISSCDDSDCRPGASAVGGVHPGRNRPNARHDEESKDGSTGSRGEEDSGMPILSATLVPDEESVDRDEENQEIKVLATAMPVTWKSTLEDKRVCLLLVAVLVLALGLSLGLGLSLPANDGGDVALEANEPDEVLLEIDTDSPTKAPTPGPTAIPSIHPTAVPSITPTPAPTLSSAPSQNPTLTPVDPSRAKWIRIGADLNGDEFSGTSVSLSGDGTTLAVGNLGDHAEKGKVDIYKRIGNIAWTLSSIVIEGRDVGDGCCSAIALSQDGTTLAVGSHLNDAAGTDFGVVQVYRRRGGADEETDNDDWHRLGNPILGTSGVDGWPGGELFGYAVSLSSTGNILAVGAPQKDGNDGSTFGEARVYEYEDVTDGDWIPLGQFLDDGGCYEYGEFGRSVSLSGDGRILAVGAPEFDSPYDQIGQTQIFVFGDASNNNRGRWERIGDEIFGEARLDRSGTSIALARDGRTVAIGGPGNNVDEDTFSGPGHVRVYRRFGDNWSQIGQDIDGKLDNGVLGTSVAISDDGAIIAVGAPGNGTGYAQVYFLDDTGNGQWEQVGEDLVGEQIGDGFGESVSLSSDGRIVAIGAPRNQEGRGNPNGHVRVFRLDHED